MVLNFMSTEIDRFEGLIQKYVRISFSKKIVNKGLLYKGSERLRLVVNKVQ